MQDSVEQDTTPPSLPTATTRRTQRRVLHRVALALGLVAAVGAGVLLERAHEHAPRNVVIWMTGYSFQDNNPPNSADISNPVRHAKAGGIGTYDDPITAAVYGDRRHLNVPAGTRFYLPTVSRYVIVEDSGASPPPPDDDTHLDVYVDGQTGPGATREATEACEQRITGQHVPAVMNPPDGLPVTPGPIWGNGRCNAPLLPAADR